MNDHSLRDLERYFAGELGGDMGLRSNLGVMLEYGCRAGGSGRTPSAPAGAALAAARVTRRVEETLAALTVEQRAVLAAWAGLPVLDQVVHRDDGRVERHAAIPGRVPHLKGRTFAVACIVVGFGRLRELAIAANGPRGDAKTEATRELRRIAGRATREVREAEAAYVAAAAEGRERRRAERRQAFRRSFES